MGNPPLFYYIRFLPENCLLIVSRENTSRWYFNNQRLSDFYLRDSFRTLRMRSELRTVIRVTPTSAKMAAAMGA